MELIGLGYNMMSSNDSRYIKKIIKNINGCYRYINYCDKLIKNGMFLKGELKDGIIIDYNMNHIIIYNVNNFKINMNKKAAYPYYSYINTIITNDGTMYNNIEYYCNISRKSLQESDTQIFIQFYINSVNDYHSPNKDPLYYYENPFINGINDLKFIDELPFDINNNSTTYNSINELLNLCN